MNSDSVKMHGINVKEKNDSSTVHHTVLLYTVASKWGHNGGTTPLKLCLLLLIVPYNIYVMENPTSHLVSSTYHRLFVAALWTIVFMQHAP